MKSLRDCRSSRDFEKYAKSKGAGIEEGTRHTAVVTDKGKTFLPRHKKDLAISTRWAIVKQFILLGLAVLVVFILINILVVIL